MRLFVAINFPAPMRGRLWSAAAPLRDAGFPVRWVGRDLIHLTLKFLGEVDPARCDSIGEGMRRAADGTRAFHLPIGGFGAFPNLKLPRVLWVGCDGVPVLELLQDGLEREMAALGFEIEGRPFRPHVTIGRAARGAGAAEFAGLETMLDELEFFEEPKITSVDLVRSHLGRGGPRYERMVAVDFDA